MAKLNCAQLPAAPNSPTLPYISGMRERYDEFEEQAKQLSGLTAYMYDTRRKANRKLQPGESRSNEVQFDGKERYRVNVYYVILDRLKAELERRGEVYKGLNSNFAFLTKLTELQPSEVYNGVRNLVEQYSDDLEESLVEECLHFRGHIRNLNETNDTDSDSDSYGETKKLSARKLCTMLRKPGTSLVNIYPNIDVALRLYLCTPATNCSTERSFSVLKRIKSFLRSKMVQDRLNALVLLATESDFVCDLNYTDVINEFAAMKARQKHV